MLEDDPEERKETEQLPITKDLMRVDAEDDDDNGESDLISESEHEENGIIRNITNQLVHDSSGELAGVDVEFNEMERTVA